MEEMDLAGYGETGDMAVIAKLAWDGLLKSVKEGFTTEAQARELFASWFSLDRISD